MRNLMAMVVVVLAARVATAQPAAGAGSDNGSADTSPPTSPTGTPQTASGTTTTGGVQWQGRTIERIQFRGNRKVEDDAIRVQLLSKAGTLLDPTKLREDLRTMWKMGFFADIDVEGEVNSNGSLTLTFAVKEKPSVRKVLIAGNSELELSKINEVIDLELDAIVDISKVKKNRDKIADLYVQKGYYLATVDWEVKSVNEAEVDVWFKIDEKA
ncbi:MAG: POTRA domain-containing protein, partial [Kofleriaceae bacterium]